LTPLNNKSLNVYFSVSFVIMATLAQNPTAFWYNKIIMADEIDRKKPISVSAFIKAIRPIVQLYLSCTQTNGQILSSELQKGEAEIAEYIERAWSAVCRKWPKCFREDGHECNESYNICKGIGVFPIYALFYECISVCEGNFELGLSMFINTVDRSKVSSSDWLVGGTFTGMSSGQAIKKIVRYIKNEPLEQL